ncbi:MULTISPECIES: hypothetical protein [unclassified Cupriavidus]|uniref:hypothetical protein n=1 Tax=unclassified Cupriavidus TaxID=2640874 RepID=UPI000414AE91|nr:MULTISPECIES: hypothetical protein [unclassified Cupriavidus]MBP0629577.1 hypothetical protein [Cupriavidus sp. AcVe19-1a]MBP0639236.1 hypothetical protein [Cupriavidus sp. AcVe19-6a]
MATATVPNASTRHAAALARILQVTQQAWGLGQENNESIASATTRGASGQRAPRLSRRARLAQAAARAFEAQIMAIRCRQVFVG